MSASRTGKNVFMQSFCIFLINKCIKSHQKKKLFPDKKFTLLWMKNYWSALQLASMEKAIYQ